MWLGPRPLTGLTYKAGGVVEAAICYSGDMLNPHTALPDHYESSDPAYAERQSTSEHRPPGRTSQKEANAIQHPTRVLCSKKSNDSDVGDDDDETQSTAAFDSLTD